MIDIGPDSKEGQLSQDEIMKSAATENHFKPVRGRLSKISKAIDDVIAHQEYEREKEQKYKEITTSLNGSFINMVIFQLLSVLACAAFSVISLRKFFVKKAIY